ncbi:MAG: hypothetical protein IJC71_04970 [Clostridia bacterium]|nr:hypothetical protein [Clostridia bacterium]
MKTILTLTLSPAIDIEYHTDEVNPAGLNRTSSHTVTAGGKGINVSRVIGRCLNRRIRLPEEVRLVTVAPAGGAMGRLLCDILDSEGIALTAVEIEENTRTNVSLIARDGGEIEINAPGTPVGDKLGEIEKIVLDSVGEGDVAVIAGSCPSDVPKSYPAELCAKIKAKGAYCILDCDGEALKIAVNADCVPDLIKPNAQELSGLVGKTLVTTQELAAAAESLAVPVVITTMAGDGAMITREVNDYRATTLVPTEKMSVVRLKGAGDTFLGAFVYAKYAAAMTDIEAMSFASDLAGHYVAGE